MITYKLAQEIVSQTMLRLHHNVNVISLDGTILASGDSTRIENYHPGAKEVIETKQPVIINEEDLIRYPLTKAGINLPILFQEEIVCVVGITGNPKDIQDVANLVQLTTEMIVNQALLESQSEWQRKMSLHIFYELIDGAEIKGILKERINKLPFPLEPPFTISIIHAQHKTTSHRTLIQYLEDFFHQQPVLYGHHQLNEYYILTPATNEYALKSMIITLNEFLSKHFAIHIGIGKSVDEIAKIPHAYKTAKLAEEHREANSSITFFEAVELKSLFQEDVAKTYSLSLLSRLDSKLIDTMQALFENNLQLSATADQLQIHRHTLSYRLEKIKERCQLNPLLFEDALKLQIALWFKS